jgi:hypothetical protein
MKMWWVEDGSRRWRSYDAKVVGILFTNRPVVPTDKGTFRVEDKREGSIMLLSSLTQESELLYEIETVGSPRAGQEDEVEELHALKPNSLA